MGANTQIEWCDATLNLWWGCTKVSAGCMNCYAEGLADKRLGRSNWGPKGTRQEVKSWRSTLRKISKQAKEEGRRLRVFVQSMSDTFEGPDTMGGPESENWEIVRRLVTELMFAIVDHPELDFLVLTKRPENAHAFFMGYTKNLQLPNNLWIGTSVEDQATADARIPELLKIPAKVRFLSMEPLLGAVDLGHWIGPHGYCVFCGSPKGDAEPHDAENPWKACLNSQCEAAHENKASASYRRPFHWVIVGGESGKNARPMHPDWVRSLRDQCVAAHVPFFFKQWGEWVVETHPAADPHADEVSDVFVKRVDPYDYQGLHMCKVGKKKAGRVLDGRTWDEFPKVQP